MQKRGTVRAEKEAGINERKRIVAEALIQKAGDLVEFWDGGPDESVDISAAEAREFIAGWLKYLPGDAWDLRLGPAPE